MHFLNRLKTKCYYEQAKLKPFKTQFSTQEFSSKFVKRFPNIFLSIIFLLLYFNFKNDNKIVSNLKRP
jgi:Cu/Ag efflux pump CusA